MTVNYHQSVMPPAVLSPNKLTQIGALGKQGLGCLPLRWESLMHPRQHVSHIPQGVMGLQFYGSWCSSRPSYGEGIQEASHQPSSPHHDPLLHNQAGRRKYSPIHHITEGVHYNSLLNFLSTVIGNFNSSSKNHLCWTVNNLMPSTTSWPRQV